MKFRARLPESNVNVTPVSPVREFLILLAGVVGLTVGIYLVLGLAVDLIVPHLPISIEQRISGWFKGLQTTEPEDSEKARAVQDIVERLQGNCARLPYDFTVHVHDDEMANAAALPGGHIVVFSGLLDKVTSENELAFIMAHELGHYANRDHLKGLGRSVVFMALSAVVLGSNSSVGSLLADSINLTELGFSRSQEARADAYALDLLDCAYGHVGGSTDFFRKMAEEEDPDIFGHYFSTHPENRDRMDRLAELARERKYPVAPLKDLPFQQ